MRSMLFAAALLAVTACKKEELPPVAVQVKAEPVKEAAPPAENEYLVTLNALPPYTAGQEAKATIALAARNGFHVNPDYPVSFKPGTAEGVKFSGERVQLKAGAKTPCADNKEDACAVEIELPLTPEKAGMAKFEGVLSFSVCNPEKCLTPKETLSLAIDVQ